MTLEQVAERLGGCSVKTVRRRIASGELRASHPGRGLWDVSEDDLQAYLDAVATRPRRMRPLPAARPVTTPTPGSALPSAASRGPRRRGRPSDGRLIITPDMGRR